MDEDLGRANTYGKEETVNYFSCTWSFPAFLVNLPFSLWFLLLVHGDYEEALNVWPELWICHGGVMK